MHPVKTCKMQIRVTRIRLKAATCVFLGLGFVLATARTSWGSDPLVTDIKVTFVSSTQVQVLAQPGPGFSFPPRIDYTTTFSTQSGQQCTSALGRPCFIGGLRPGVQYVLDVMIEQSFPRATIASQSRVFTFTMPKPSSKVSKKKR